ncbi:MAG: coiled-coil domain-containing protein [Ruminococcus sp.]
MEFRQRRKEEQLKTLNTQLEEAKATADKQYQDMKKRIVYMYENGSASMLELLLSSEDLAQFLNRAENIAQISQYDRDMLAKYKALQADIKAQEEQAEEEAQNINELLAEKSAKQQGYRHLLQAQMRTFSPIFIRSVPARMKSVL